MQTQISKLGRSRLQSKGLHYFKSAEVCTCKHFQKSARSNDIKSLFFLHIKGLHFMRLYKSPFTRRPCESSISPRTLKVHLCPHLESPLALVHLTSLHHFANLKSLAPAARFASPFAPAHTTSLSQSKPHTPLRNAR